jgi:hypothetical protein
MLRVVHVARKHVLIEIALAALRDSRFEDLPSLFFRALSFFSVPLLATSQREPLHKSSPRRKLSAKLIPRSLRGTVYYTFVYTLRSIASYALLSMRKRYPAILGERSHRLQRFTTELDDIGFYPPW